MTEQSATERWAAELAEWKIPDRILKAATQEPYVFPPQMFKAPEPGGERTRATELAAEALPDDGSVLDVGCGGGRAGFALVPPAARIIGTDVQGDMLELLAQTAAERGVEAETVQGAWPDVADRVPTADVVVSHHVLYNIADPVPFVEALASHARHRVVIEVTERHPQTSRNPLWRHFWDLDRPEGPTAWLLAEALEDAGIPVRAEAFTSEPRHYTHGLEATFWTRQLCLPAEREPEVAEQLAQLDRTTARVVLWWDV